MHHHSFFPVGAVLPYAGPLAASDGGDGIDLAHILANLHNTGWLACDGAAYAQIQYAQLFGVIGKAFGGDDGTFNVPDMRGRFLRGVAGASDNDPEKTKRIVSAPGGNDKNKVGSLQRDAFQQHEHDYLALIPLTPYTPAEEGEPVYSAPEKPTATTGCVAAPGQDAPRASSETRPLNLYINYIIRYF